MIGSDFGRLADRGSGVPYQPAANGPLSAIAALLSTTAPGQPRARPVARQPTPQRTVAALPDPSMGPLSTMKDLSGVTTAPDLGAEVAPITQPSAAPGPLPQQSILSRILEFVRSDQGRAALLRSGAATMRGGLGAGIEAGAGYVDQQKANATKAQQQGLENIFAQERINQGDRGLRNQEQQTDNSFTGTMAGIGATVEHNRATERLQGYGITSENMRTDKTLAQRERESVRQQIMDKYKVDINMMSDQQARELQARLASDNNATASSIAEGRNRTDIQVAGMRAAGIGSKGTGKGLTAKARAAAQPAPVDPANREVGKIYRSPTGDYGQWTLDGWVPVN